MGKESKGINMSFTSCGVKPWRRILRNSTAKMNIIGALVDVRTDDYTHRDLFVMQYKNQDYHLGMCVDYNPTDDTYTVQFFDSRGNLLDDRTIVSPEQIANAAPFARKWFKKTT